MTAEELTEQGLTEEQVSYVMAAWEQRERDIALDRALEDVPFSSQAAREAVTERVRQAQLPIENGVPVGLDELLAAIREQDPGAFLPQREAVIFTAPLGGAETPTREQIISIPDRARRRAAIAENMRLFKGEN